MILLNNSEFIKKLVDEIMLGKRLYFNCARCCGKSTFINNLMKEVPKRLEENNG